MIKFKHLLQKMMAWKLINKLCFCLLFSCFLLLIPTITSASSISSDVKEENAYIPAGTKLTIRLEENINDADVNIGDIVQMKLVGNVCINGIPVIKSKTPVMAKVIEASHSRVYGRTGKLGIKVESVQTVNNLTVPLTGEKERKIGNNDNAWTAGLIGGLFIKGGHATLRKGTLLTAIVEKDVDLQIKKEELFKLQQLQDEEKNENRTS